MDKKKPQYETTLCPKCGVTSEVTSGNTLIACCRCAMSGASRLWAGEVKENGLYDWPATIKALKEAMGASKERQVAFFLGIDDNDLSKVKRGLRPMPKKALQLIRERWTEALKTVQSHVGVQAAEKPQDEFKAEAARVVAKPPFFARLISNENSDLAGVKKEVTDLFKEGFIQ